MGWSEELRSSTRLCRQEKEKGAPREQEQEEIAADDIRHKVLEQGLEEAGDDDESEKLEQRGEKRQHQDEGIKTDIHQAQKVFFDDVQSTFGRIKVRAKELEKQRVQEEADGSGGVEQIQLHAVDPGL